MPYRPTMDQSHERHFIGQELTDLLEEMPTLHLIPPSAQRAWELRKLDLVRRLEALNARDEANRVRSV